MKRSLIVAMSEDRVIGHAGQLPWKLSSDLRRFKQITMGHHLIMGRKTYESIGCLLPGRTTVIVSRQSDYTVPGAVVVDSLEKAWQVAAQDEESFVIGGGQIYQAALPMADRLYLTQVQASVPGDTWFPAFDPAGWQLVEEQQIATSQRDQFPTTFQILDRMHERTTS